MSCQLDMTTIYKQTKHIFTLTNNIMFDLLVFTRMLEIYKCIKEIKEPVAQYLGFCVVFYEQLFVLVLFLLVIQLSILL
jgi:hypothetical protein